MWHFLTASEMLVGVAVAALTYWLWQRRAIYLFALGYPFAVFGVPPFGAFAYMGNVRRMLPFMQRQWRRCADRTMCIWLGLTPCLFVADADVVEQLLTMTEFATKSPLIYGPVHDVLEGGLVAETPERAAQLRKYFAPAFRHKNLLGLLPLLNARAERFVRQLELKVGASDGAAMPDLLQQLHVFTLATSKRTVMGYTKEEDDDDFKTIMERLRFTFTHVVLEITFNLLHARKLIQYNPLSLYVRGKLKRFGHEVLTHRIKYLATAKRPSDHNANELAKGGGGREPFLFIDQAYKHYQSGHLKWLDVVSESNGLLVASYETSSSTLFSSLLLLAMHADVQERLYEEISAAFPPHAPPVVNYERLQQLQYLDMVVNEVLRVLPAVPMIARQCTAPGVLNVRGRYHKVPRGMQLLVDIYELHRDTRVWGADAHTFNPDHFLPHSAAQRSAYAFIPFSKGPRNCMGWAYAYFVIKVLLVHIVRTYKLSTPLRYADISVTMSIFLEHTASACLHLQRRKVAS